MSSNHTLLSTLWLCSLTDGHNTTIASLQRPFRQPMAFCAKNVHCGSQFTWFNASYSEGLILARWLVWTPELRKSLHLVLQGRHSCILLLSTYTFLQFAHFFCLYLWCASSLSSPQIQYFLGSPLTKIRHVFLPKSKAHISAVEVNVFEHEHATIPSTTTNNSVQGTLCGF